MTGGLRRDNPRITEEAEKNILFAIKDGCSYAELRRMFPISDRDIMLIKIKHNLLPPDSPHWRPTPKQN